MLSTQKVVLFHFIFVCGLSLHAQDYNSILLGRWVTTDSNFPQEIESSSASSYLQYKFDLNNIVSYGTNPYEHPHRSDYSVFGNKLKMFHSEYLIESYKDDQLNLVATNTSNALYRISLIRKERFDSIWTRHNPSLMISPYLFTANFSLYNYIFSTANTPEEFERNILSLYQNHIPPKYDQLLKIKFTFDRRGEVIVESIDGLPKISTSTSSKIKRRIENTSGYWVNISTEGTRSDTLVLNFLTRGKAYFDFKNKAFRYFQLAAEYFVKQDYLQGMRLINQAISTQDNNFQFYQLRALFYFKLEDIDKYCGDIVKANSINPLVSLLQTEMIDGEQIEITCTKK
jgi:hypothetical protein